MSSARVLAGINSLQEGGKRLDRTSDPLDKRSSARIYCLGREVSRVAKPMRIKLRAAGKKQKRTTAMTFTTEDLSSLARLVAGGQVLLQTTSPVVARLKAALTRMGLPVPQGL